MIPPLFSGSGGGESIGKRHLRGGEQEPGAADPDRPVPAQAAARQHQPAQHDPERCHRRRRERGHRQIPRGRTEGLIKNVTC